MTMPWPRVSFATLECELLAKRKKFRDFKKTTGGDIREEILEKDSGAKAANCPLKRGKSNLLLLLPPALH